MKHAKHGKGEHDEHGPRQGGDPGVGLIHAHPVVCSEWIRESLFGMSCSPCSSLKSVASPFTEKRPSSNDYYLGGLDPLDWDSKVKIALGTARGICHLHNQDEGTGKLLHGNIKSSNVLLTADLNACISDYGLNLILKHSAPTSPYSASTNDPKLDKRSKKVTRESDVYRFGALLLELLTEQRPDSVIFTKWVCDIVSEKEISVVKESQHFKVGNCKEGMIKMLRIAMLCLKNISNMQPKMDEVVSLIEDIKPSQHIQDAK